MSATPDRTSHDGFRPEVEGLRGVAVLIVVLFHAGLAGVTGGFVGVDVFFVISGFLITGLLLREHERTGRIAFLAFYARRARRLLPAAVVVLIVTLIAAMNLVAPLDRPSVGLDGAAAALSLGNIRFALASGDYFANVAAPSPFLHFWSLAVEEQFYLVWPALILIVARGVHARRRVVLALLGLVMASFVGNVVLTDLAANWAFYSLPTRAWELGLGGLVAVVAGAGIVDRAPRGLASVFGWLGLAAILIATFSFDQAMAWPGSAALVPAVGAAVLVASGRGRLGPSLLLATAPLRFLGRISYSLYLVHWPILVLAPFALGGQVDELGRAGLVLLSVLAATLSWAVIETPFRGPLPRLVSPPGRTVSVGLASILAVVVIAAAPSMGWGAAPAAAAETTASALIDTSDASWPDDLVVPLPSTGPSHQPAPSPTSPTTNPAPSAKPAASPVPRPVLPEDVAATGALSSDVRPALADARGDEERLRADGCLAFERVTVPPDCIYGVPAGAFTVALVGDSHAAQWFPALDRLARHEGWRVVTFVKVACPFIDMPVRNTALKRDYRECADFNEATIARLNAIRPDLTLVSMSRIAIHPLTTTDDTVAAKGAAVGRMLSRLSGRVAIIVDTPYAGRDVPACLSANLADVEACAIPQAVAFTDHLGALEKAAAKAAGADRIDLTQHICIGTPCPVVVNDRIVYRDIGHLTATFARSLAPALAAAIALILAR
ncbi:MAG TPA: acyltransferase family protein [Candidatus Limnocylindrales bacterium]|nr:acyltransferase family protein [Candidatus Limnocylindrales bacterium]